MLEAIRDRAQGWIAKVILALLIVPFALWGVDSYFTGGGQEKPAATIGDTEISARDFQKSLADQKEALGGQVDDKALRQLVIDQLINTRVLTDAATRAGFAILEPQIQAMLQGLEPFQENGQFSQVRFDAWLRSRGMSQAELMSMLHQDLLLRQVQTGLAEGALVAKPSVDQLARLLGQQREVNEIEYPAQRYAGQVQVDDAAVQADYDAHKDAYATPRQVRVQYAVLSQTEMGQSIQVDEAAVRKFYEANLTRFQEPDRRRASHILIQVPEGADDKVRAQARQKAESILAEARKTPARFADLARQHSQDPGSGQNGGDLGAFTRDAMVKPFADAVWAMQPGELRGLVESQFGFHIIRLDGVVPGARMGLEVVRDEVLQELRQQEAQRRFAEAAERFSNMVYEQPDSLEPVAKEFNLKLETSGWVDEKQAAPAFLANPRLQESLFSEDSLNKRNNVEAVEVAPNVLVSARVVEYRPAGVRPLADVTAEIRQKLVQERSRKMAIEAGKQALASAQAGQPVAGWSAAMTLSRVQPLNIPREAVKAVFRANVARLPAHVGVETPDGYRMYRITRVNDTDVAAQVEPMAADLRRMVAQEEVRAYVESLKAAAKIEIAPDTLAGSN
jgi:peptidyl-prolyl cis-trans isomerase D